MRHLLLTLGLGLGLGLSGCGLLDGELPMEPVGAVVSDSQVGSGEPVLLTVYQAAPEGWSVDVGVPVAEGLEVVERSAPTLADDLLPDVGPGGSVVVTGYAFTGPDGSYQIQFAPATVTEPDGIAQEVELGPFFVDIGVPGPSGGQLAGLAAAQPAPGLPWGWIAGVALFMAAFMGLAGAWLMRPKEEEPGPPPLSAAEQAARDWAGTRASGLDDHPQAVGLSRVFRVYLEQSSGWPATRRTGAEILAWLRDTGRLGPADQARSARILQATDLLKFAREGGGQEFFDSLDRDFEGILEADRLSAPELPEPVDDGVAGA